jgi:E3 ubiquitin-protein ligase DOA10
MKFLAVDCATLWPVISLIKNGIIPLIQVGIPIILIVLGMLDLGKAVIASKEDEIKSAQKMLIKRAIYAVAIFFVVLIVQLVFGLLSSAGDDYGTQGESWTTCWNYK